MKSLVILVFVALLVQICTSATVGDAEIKLQRLRDITTHKLKSAFFDHSRMFNEIEATALATKEHGKFIIQKKTEQKVDKALTNRCRGSQKPIYENLIRSNIDALIRCVDQQSAEGVNVLATQTLALSKHVWSAIFTVETRIIRCGQSRECLDVLIASIDDKIDEVTKVIDANVEISNHNKEVRVQRIKSCVSASIASVEHALSTNPTCKY